MSKKAFLRGQNLGFPSKSKKKPKTTQKQTKANKKGLGPSELALC